MHKVIIWETEEYRNIGESIDYATDFSDKEDAINTANSLFNRYGYSVIEVEDSIGEVVYHISIDAPTGERY